MKTLTTTSSQTLTLLLTLLMTLASCNDSFTGIIGDGYIPDPDRDASSTEVIKDRMPILPYIVDPEYSIYSPGSRAFGPLGSWDNDMDKWKHAQFYLYAFRMPNYANHTAANFSDESERLCFNDRTRITAEGAMQFYDFNQTPIENEYYEMHYYDAVNSDFRYSFFTYFADDATVKNEVCTRRQLKYDVSGLDGTQDVMVGYAYHTEKELSDKIEELKKHGFGGSESLRLLSQHRQELLYSNFSAQRALQPCLHLQHLMTRFEVRIKGCYSASNPTRPAFRNVVVTGIELEACNAGTMTVANEEWVDSERFNQDHDAGNLFTADRSTLLFRSLPIVEQERQGNAAADYDMLRRWILENVDSPVGDPDKWFHVNSDHDCPLSSQDYLVPPAESYRLRVNYYYVNRLFDENNRPTNLISEDFKVYDLNGQNNAITVYPVRAPQDGRFKPGRKYIIELDIYGLEKINVETSMLEGWAVGGNTELDSDM